MVDPKAEAGRQAIDVLRRLLVMPLTLVPPPQALYWEMQGIVAAYDADEQQEETMADHLIGACKHGKPVHYGFPCEDCIGEQVADQIADEVVGTMIFRQAGTTWESRVGPRIARVVAAAVRDALARVRQYDKT